MSRLRLAPLAISLSLCGFAEAATVQHSEPLRAFAVSAADAGRDARGRATQGAVADAGSNARGRVAEKPTVAATTVVTFNAFSRDFALELEPNGRLAGLERQFGTTPYRGKIAGNGESWVRLVLTPEGPSGLVFDGDTLYGIEAGRNAGSAPAMFRLADVYFAPGELGCEIGAAAIDGERAVAAMTQEFTALAATLANRRLDLGAVADFEFSLAFGASAEAELVARLNNVDGIFSQQLGVQISVAEVDIFTANDDPFTSTAGSELLDELANYRGATASQDALGLTHLLTGRDLDGTTAGVAFFGAVCARRTPFDTRSFGAGLSEARRGAVIDSLVAAHEIGHTFGAPHDGDANSECASTPTTFLMAPSISGSNQFSACSIQQMQPEIDGASCLTPIGPADMSVRLLQPAQAYAGFQLTHSATARNDGADEATGVVFTATAEPGLAILAAEAGASSCSVSPSSATCALGAIGGGASRGITLTLNAPDPGAFDLTAVVTADIDADPRRDSATVVVTAVRAVDLVWSAATAVVQVDAQTTVTATLQNAADFAASSIAVTATLSDGVRPDQATLGGTSCTISNQSITCPTQQQLAPRGTVDFRVVVTGRTAGSQRVTVAASSADTERTPGDNQREITVSVNSPQSSDGGGGALSWLAVAALLAACGFGRGRSSERHRPS